MTFDGRLVALAAGLALIWAVLISIPTLRGSGDAFETLEHASLDWRVRSFGAREPPGELVIVALDDATHAASTIGEERRQLTSLVEALAAAGARVLAIDILLTDSGPAELDAGLTEALRRSPTIIAGAASGLSTGSGIGIPRASAELWPQEQFRASSTIGLVNIITDAAGLPRYVPTLFVTSRGVVPSFALRAASDFAGTDLEIGVGAIRLGSRSLRLDHGYLLPLRPFGPAGSVRTISAMEYLSGGGPRLDGKLVVLGNTATGLGDRFPSPFGGTLTGVEVIATAIAHFVDPETALARTTSTRRVDAAAAGTLAVLCTVCVLAFPLAWGAVTSAALMLTWLAIAWAAFASGIWLAVALPLLAAALPAALAGIWRYARERSHAIATDRTMNALKKFQSPQLAKLMESDPEFLSSPESSKVTILFVDLAGFTAISQILGPQGTELLLKRFHRRVSRIVDEHGGLVFNYMGDGALAVFGLLDEEGRADPQALRAAFALVAGMRALDDELGLAGKLACRVGLHFGTVILSRLGDDLHQQFSVSGDSVNLASRLLEAAKAEDAAIAATAGTLDRTASADVRPPDARKHVTLRGRQGAVEILFWSA